jgi:hypothetical protein
MTTSMLSTLELLSAHVRSWAWTGNEFWSYFSYDYEDKWALARDSSMTKPKVLIKFSKIMALIIWDVDGPALVEPISPNLRVSAKYLCEFTILHLDANVKTHRLKQGLKRITFHSDNAPSHTAKVTITKISELIMNQMPPLPCFQGLPKRFLPFRTFETQTPRMLLRLSIWTCLRNHGFNGKSRKTASSSRLQWVDLTSSSCCGKW